ncbi:hypothetical protein EV356DRAFT_466961 [Viridothelium virens]|uniref:Rhodopsin domain-containing protein n=1 Tax=Viridothelium virens TaxID=1048519 RepID=A0A6A6H8Q8_VIRVR|nr:hypothetical protein EV356DRAFT_466961 [Viridothelium virens]
MKVRGWLGFEDCMVIGSMPTSLLVTGLIGCMAIANGFGVHERDIKRVHGNLQNALKYFFLYQVLYKITICFNKLAFLLLYDRIFTNSGFRKVCRVTIAVVILGTLSFLLATVFQCEPISKNWDKHAKGHCINNSVFRWSWAAYNTLTDLLIVFMPIPGVKHLQMSRAKKVGLIVVFGLGLFICFTSAFRMQALVESTELSDTTWDSLPAFVWSQMEATVGLLCTNLPSLKERFIQFFPRSWTRSPSDNNARPAPRPCNVPGKAENHPSVFDHASSPQFVFLLFANNWYGYSPGNVAACTTRTPSQTARALNSEEVLVNVHVTQTRQWTAQVRFNG